MRTRRRFVLLITLIVCGLGLALAAVFFWMHRNRYENAAMVVTWKEGTGKPLTVEGIVFLRGTPAANRVVYVETGSGGHRVTTGPDGRFCINVGELELTALGIEGTGKVEWSLLGAPNVQDGISVKIELK